MLDKFAQAEYENLVAQGLAKRHVHNLVSGTITFYNFSKKVFWDQLWDASPYLVYARGIAFDENGECVFHPFDKVFNYGERNTGSTWEDDDLVVTSYKVNGFLVQMTAHQGKVILATKTTPCYIGEDGSLGNDYTELAKSFVTNRIVRMVSEYPSNTFLFECVDTTNDPHPVLEKENGLTLLGVRSKTNTFGYYSELLYLEEIAGQYLVPYSESDVMSWGDALYLNSVSTNEGYMVHNLIKGETLKLKTPYYMTIKFISRNKKALALLWSNWNAFIKHPRIEEEHINVASYLRENYTQDEWFSMHQTDRADIVRAYFEVNPF